MLACSPPRPSRFLADCGELALKVRGQEHDGRVLRIRSPKCTIGSASGCTLRLMGAGVAPLHCWVLRGKYGTVVRQLRGRVSVNGAAAEESRLSPGDRFRVGEVELEVIECNRPQTHSRAELIGLPPVDRAELERELTTALDEIKRLEAESRQGIQSSITAADRADQLRTALAETHHQLDETSRELAAAQRTLQRQNDELETLRSELSVGKQSAAEQLDLQSRTHLETAALRDELTRCQADLNEARSALGGAQDERARAAEAAADVERRLADEQERWRNEQKQWQEEQVQLQRRLAQRDAELEALREQSATQTGVMTVSTGHMTVRTGNVTEPAGNVTVPTGNITVPTGNMTVNMEEVRRETEVTENQERSKRAEAERQLSETRRELADAMARIQEAEGASARCVELESQLRDVRERAESSDEQRRALDLRAAELAAQQETLQAAERELAVERERLAHSIREAAQRLREQEAHAEQRATELERSLESASARLSELDSLRTQLVAERDALGERAERLAQRELEAETRLAPPPLPPAQPPSEFGRLIELQDELGASQADRRQLAEQIEALEVRCRELEEQRCSALAQAAAAYGNSVAEKPRRAAEPTAAERPPIVTVSFQSLQAERALQEETAPAVSEAAGEPVAPANPSVALAAAEPESQQVSPPVSLFGYMEQLAAKARGEKSAAEPPQIQFPLQRAAPNLMLPPVEETPAAESRPDPATAEPEASETAAQDEPEAPVQTLDPEQRQQLTRWVIARLGSGAAAVAISGVLGYWAWTSNSMPAGAAAAVGAAIGAFWTIASIRRLGAIMALSPPEPLPQSLLDAEEAAQAKAAAEEARRAAAKKK